MYGNLKRFISVIITIAVMMTMIVTPGFAGEMSAVYSDQDEAADEEFIQEEIETSTYSQETGEDEEGYNDELFANYVASQFFPDIEGYSDKNGMLRSIYLSDMNQIIYSKLKSQIEKVAAGDSTSTVFTVSVEDLGLTSAVWTAEDLGLPYLTVNGQLTDAAKEAIIDQLEIDTGRVLDALLAQCPYELYWHDKTAGVRISGPGYSFNTRQVRITSGFTFSFNVAGNYADGQYSVSRYHIGRVVYAVETANEIVSEAAGFSDQDKLMYYKDRICDLVSYDYAALNSSYGYGDPWQLISVFDDDESTNVVCEGYSKAFKYLCDLSTFDDQELECILVSGIMSGATGAGDHMWNIVTIGGGNYLVDVTNCDEDSIGAPDQLFLVGTEDGSVQDGYTFSLAGGDIYYSYDETTLGTYGSELELSFGKYEGTPVYTTDDGISYSVINDAAVIMGFEELSDHVIIPEEIEGYPVTSIRRNAFYGMSTLSEIYIPSSVTSIGTDAFANSNLTFIHYQGTGADWENILKGYNAIPEEAEVGSQAELVNGHIYYDEYSITTAPTCTEEGVGTRECRICGELQTIAVPALGHDLIRHEGKEATCTEGGWSEYDTCARCDYSTYTATEPKGHTPEVIEAVEPTCTETGLTEGSRCSVCGELLKMQIQVSALGHDYHIEEGSAVEPTCTTDGKEADQICARCGERKAGTLLLAKGHTEIILYREEPTCTETGLTEGKKCYFCDEILVAQEEIPAIGHSWGEWTVVKEATADEDGLKRRVCANDASHVEEEVIPMTGGGETPPDKPELVPETLWDKAESFGSPHFSNVDNEEDLEIVSVVSSNTDVLEIQYGEDPRYIYDYILKPVKPGTSTVTVTYLLDGVEGSTSAIYTVLESSGGTPDDPVEEVITAVYERATPFEVVMERDYKDYGGGMTYYGKTFDYPDAGDKVTISFPDGTVKNYEYEKKGASNGKFVNTEDASDVILWNEISINIYAQADDWEPGGDKNYYEVSFINYPDDGKVVTCRVPVEVSSTPVASVAYEPVPVLLWAPDAARSGMPEGNKVTVTYKDGTSEVFIDDPDTHSWISQNTMEPVPDNDNIYYEIWINEDREDLSCTASYMGVTSEKNYSALYIAQSISLYQEEPMELIKGKDSTIKTDAAGNQYESYSLNQYDWFGDNDVLTVTYKNGLGEYIDVDYATDSEISFSLLEDSPYYSGYPDDHLSGTYITIHMPDQSENHFEAGKTYSMDMTFHKYGSNFDLPAFTTEGEPYKVLIKEEENDENVLSDETVSLSQTVFPYTGSMVAIGNYVLYNGTPVPGSNLSINYTAIGNVGQQPKYIGDVKAEIIGVYGGYTGTATKYYTIKGDLSRNATNVKVSFDADEYTYSGSPVEPKVSVTAVGKGGGTATLVEGQDYTVSYENNNAAGTGNVVITAVEGSYYMNEKRVPFAITEDIKTGWVQDGEDWYYYDDNGKMVTSRWQKDSKGWCYLAADGKMVTNGWAKDSKGYCWIGSSGYMVEKTQWLKANGSWYHITIGYRDQSKWMKDSKGWCYVGPDGKMVTNGWAKDSKGWCWMGADGYWVSNKWIQSGGQWYYIKSNHYMAAEEWAKDGGGWMYMDASGKITKNKWVKSGGYWYYLKSNGYMAIGTQTIGGKTYKFDSAGRLIS